MCNLFDTPDVPTPPSPTAPLPILDPEEAARRRNAALKRNVTRDSLVIDQGVAGVSNPTNTGTGIKLG